MDQPTVFASPLGFIAFSVREGAVLAVTFGHRTAAAAIRALLRRLTTTSRYQRAADHGCFDSDRNLTERVAERLASFASGAPVDFSDLVVDTSGLTSFQSEIIAQCRVIPWGETRTYGSLAAAAGRPDAARAVGSVMAANRVPLIVPCHRVVAASGGLGGFSAPQGIAMKRRLLAMERATPCESQLQMIAS